MSSSSSSLLVAVVVVALVVVVVVVFVVALVLFLVPVLFRGVLVSLDVGPLVRAANVQLGVGQGQLQFAWRQRAIKGFR